MKRRFFRGRSALCLAAACLALLASASSAAARPRPNFLVIQVDDQASNTFTRAIMPNTFSWLVNKGTFFENGLAAPPLCCPDRAGVLTGQYPHNNGVFSNHPGYPSLRNKWTTLPVWLRQAGYRTALVGKFLNHYTDHFEATPAPGFSHWFAFDGKPGYYNYGISDDGRRLTFGHRRADYSTHVFTADARSFIADSAKAKRPFFMWLAYNAPHDAPGGRNPAKRGLNCPPLAPTPPGHREGARFAHLPLPVDPSFNEADVSDKPPLVSGLAPLDATVINRVTRRYRCTAATMHATDSDIERVRTELKRTGQLARTIVVYLSDNGFFFGEHRLTRGKILPYEPDLRVPFAMSVPAAYRGHAEPGVSDATVSNTDIAPTLLDYAGDPQPCNAAGKCRVLDGRSLRPLVGGRGTFPEDRGVPAEISTRYRGEPFAYQAISTPDRIYVDYGGGLQELYDLDTDPFELDNLAGDPAHASEQAALAARVAALAACSGTEGPSACE